LAQFPAKRRRPYYPIKSQIEPLAEQCFKPVEISLSDDEEEDEEDSNSDSEDEIKKAKNKMRLEEPKVIRYFLDSSNFSSEFCSEFHYIGPKMGISWQSMQNAMVLSSTVRCAVSLKEKTGTNSEDDDENDGPYGTHIYTPALITRNWPSKYILWFTTRMMKDRAEGEAWLSHQDVRITFQIECLIF